MNAKEMFDECNLEKVYNEDFNRIDYYIKDDGRIDEPIIRFYLEDKTVAFSETWFDYMSVRLHLAIHQQMKELGWIDD